MLTSCMGLTNLSIVPSPDAALIIVSSLMEAERVPSSQNEAYS